MLEYISEDSLKNIPKLLEETMIYVEGNFDKRLYANFFNRVFIVSNDSLDCGIKDKIIKLAEESNDIIGIVDADLDHLEESYVSCPRVFYTDLYDAESQVFFSASVMGAVSENFGLEIENINQIIDTYKYVMVLRVLNRRHSLGISFDKITPIALSLGNDFKKILDVYFREAYTEEDKNGYERECQHICRNIDFKTLKIIRWHDIEHKIISKACKVNGANKNIKNMFYHFIISHYTEFTDSNLYNSIKKYAAANNAISIIKT